MSIHGTGSCLCLRTTQNRPGVVNG